jgi:hypothetical protein
MSGAGGDVFCRMVFSTYFLFVCGKASNASVMCLAIERWYAVVMPTKYKSKFGRRRLYTYIALIWLSAAVTEIFELFIAKLVDGSCQWITPPYGAKAESAFLVLHVTVTFYVPSIVTWGSFAHIWYRMSTTNTVGSGNQSANAKKRVVRMCALAAFFLTVLWFPTETFWVLKKFKVVILPRMYYLVFNLMAFFSSCVNPFIYCLCNKTYRHEVILLANGLSCCHRPTRVVPFETQTASNTLPLRTIRLQTTKHSEVDSVINTTQFKDMYMMP